ncbi:MAG: secretin N-terminal domain-containing protein [Candidatus Omnitrophica bacterium]|nr:secretin N-terminal domain-containing protein [Candidatus Omnitrophota bacterium]
MRLKVFILGISLCVNMAVFPVCALCGQQAADAMVIEALEFREVDIKDILRQLAKQYNLNIVFSESVKGLVTVQLNHVTVEQALDSVITVNNFAYTQKGNVYKVTTQDEAQREGKQTKLFKLNNADAMKLKETLAKVLGSDGSIEADSRSNAIVVTDSLMVINKIESMLPSLDEATPQVLIEAKLIETSLTNTEKLGIDWTTTITATGSKRPITFPFTKSTSGSYLPSAASSSTDFSSAQNFPYTTKSDFTFGTLDFSSFAAVLDFLKTRSKTKLIASPRVMTVNNQKATINVGKVIPLATYERNETSGAWEITGWEQQNVGVNLEVTPQISPDGHIRLKLKPEVSNILEYIGEDVNRRPITSSRTAETEVQIKDGQTIVIAGLVKNKEDSSVTKIPLLGSIPLLGWFFTRNEKGSTEEPEEKTDLLIFVTAHIIKDSGDSAPAPAEADNKAPLVKRPFKLEKRGEQ